MGSHFQQLLRNLCSDTQWNYAVFWKLKHRARMVLTWEDAYYDSNLKNDPSESKSNTEALGTLHDGHFARDPLGLAVAKMSYHVYSLGEGIVGQVAVTGKHQWILSSEINSCSALEHCDGWQAQFSAGIKTIVVVAVVPHGVIQLGSLNKVTEDPKLLSHIRNVFSVLQDSSRFHVQNPGVPTVLGTGDMSARTFGSEVFQEYLLDYEKPLNMELISSSSLVTPYPWNQGNDSYQASMPGLHLGDAMGLIGEHGLAETADNTKQIQSITNSGDLVNDSNAGQQACSSSQSHFAENISPYGVKSLPKHSEGRDKHTTFDGKENKPSTNRLKKQELAHNIEFQPKLDCLEAIDNLQSSFTLPSGSELHEALGHPFLRQCGPQSWEMENHDGGFGSQVSEVTESSLLTTDHGSDHLLEAVVASFCSKDAIHKSAKSFSTSESMLTTEKMPEPSINTSHAIGSSSYSIGCSSLFEESTQNCLNSSDSCSIRSSASACRDQLVRPSEMGKPNKKRARPGESTRPRPRDRQLIQDRIKELRELVPNGSKCSIDSLLERTIKHMVFLQSVNKHADKLSYCAKSRSSSSEMGVLGSGCEQGSSWAVEVGGHMKICPIVVENLNMNGQMQIEMLCEDCDHFLEIAEAIKSLGLTVLKGVTDSHGDKTWMRFVVEGQGNRNLHRMDVLWSLVQILQTKTSA